MLLEWYAEAEIWDSNSELPGVVGAIDGTLIQRDRPEDHEGFYNRKGLPSYNLQGVVKINMEFMDYCLCVGSQNDKQVFRKSTFGSNLSKFIPPTLHLIGDQGYGIYPNLMINYTSYEGRELSRSEKFFNNAMNKSRVKVENAFALLKNRCRALKTALVFKIDEHYAMFIVMCLIIHNITIQQNGYKLTLVIIYNFIYTYLYICIFI